MAWCRAVRRGLCTAAEVTPAPAPAPGPAPGGRWDRLKNSKAGVWCRSLVSDYKEACKEIVVGARERPLKASVYMGLVGGAYACFTTKPDQPSFQAALLERSNQLALLSPWIRNAGSDLHVQNLVKLRNQGQLRHLSLGLFCLVYGADYDPDSALYEAACSDLAVPWRELPQRVLDVGFAGRWWILDRKMVDFDVNDAEYKHLPAHMQTTAPPGVQEVERNERLHKESWLPLPVPQEDTQRTKEDTQRTKEDTQRTKEDTQTKTEEIQENPDTVVEAADVADTEVTEPFDENVDGQDSQTIDSEETQVMDTMDEKKTMDSVDSQVTESTDVIVDSQDTETIDVADDRVGETMDANVDDQVTETIDETERQVKETMDLVDTQVNETMDLVDTQVKETVVDVIVDSQVTETIEEADGQVVELVDTKEETLLDVNVDSQDVETVDKEEDGPEAETVDVQKVEVLELEEEPVPQRAAQN